MNATELQTLKDEVKPHLSEVGFKRWEKSLIKSLRTLPIREARQAVLKEADEIAKREYFLRLSNGSK